MNDKLEIIIKLSKSSSVQGGVFRRIDAPWRSGQEEFISKMSSPI